MAAYADLKTSDKNSLCLRIEHFADKTSKLSSTHLFSTPDNPVGRVRAQGYTLTDRYRLNSATEVRLEYRLDVASKSIFAKEDNGHRKDQSTLTAAWIFFL